MNGINVNMASNTGTFPAYAKPGDSGMDVVAQGFSCWDATENKLADIQESVITLKPLERVMAHTGIYMEIPEGYECQVRPRSGMALKQGITVLNSPGTVDSGYRGECNVILINLGSAPVTLQVGDRVAQFVFAPVAAAVVAPVLHKECLSVTERAAGGFGHTGTSV